MSRPLRVALAGGYYHLTSRGTERTDIFADDHDRAAFMAVLGRVVERAGWRCLSFCLMPNHFHLLVRTPMPNVSYGMQQLKSGHGRAFNSRHDRRGPLFAERFGGRLVEAGPHLIEVFRYIALNPVKAGFAVTPADWHWSAHRALAGIGPVPSVLATADALALFDPDMDRGRAAYRRFVEVGDEVAPEMPRGAVGGSKEFLARVLPERQAAPDVPAADWGEGRPSLDALLDGGTTAAIAEAHRRHGYTQREIAAALGCSAMTVSRRLRRWEETSARC